MILSEKEVIQNAMSWDDCASELEYKLRRKPTPAEIQRKFRRELGIACIEDGMDII